MIYFGVSELLIGATGSGSTFGPDKIYIYMGYIYSKSGLSAGGNLLALVGVLR